jgi:hypothetical protein
MSRASVSFDRQAVAPNDSICVHSAAVGLLASTRHVHRESLRERCTSTARESREVQQDHRGRVVAATVDLGQRNVASQRDRGSDRRRSGRSGPGDEVFELARDYASP